MNTNQKPLLENLKTPAKGLQPLVDPVKDFLYDKTLGGNSWFVCGHFEAEGHLLNYMFHLSVITLPMKVKMTMVASCLSITDETTGWYSGGDRIVPSLQAKIKESDKELYIKAPKALLEGDLNEIHVQASLSNASIDLTLNPVGHVLYNGGAGYIRQFDMRVFQYSLPTLLTKGTITIEGKTYEVNGTSWFDRQYAPVPEGKDLSAGYNCHWVWMDLNFHNHEDKISLWGMIDNETGEEYAWATVLHPDGANTVVAALPLSENAFDHWLSPNSKQNYPTRWMVKIPALDTCLEVVSSLKEQEIYGKQEVANKYEAASSFKGTYKGEDTTGYCYMELVGPWR